MKNSFRLAAEPARSVLLQFCLPNFPTCCLIPCTSLHFLSQPQPNASMSKAAQVTVLSLALNVILVLYVLARAPPVEQMQKQTTPPSCRAQQRPAAPAADILRPETAAPLAALTMATDWQAFERSIKRSHSAKRYQPLMRSQSTIPLSASSDDPKERAALSRLFATTGGSRWLNKTLWTSNSSVCSWFGVWCNLQTRRVMRLVLGGNNLDGTVPDNLNTLSSLTVLDLSNNTLHGYAIITMIR